MTRPEWTPASWGLLLVAVLAPWFCAPSVTGLDGAELVLGGVSLGVAHPPGQPSYLLLLRTLAWLPLGDLGFRAVLVSVLAGVVAVRLTMALGEELGLGRAAPWAGLGLACSAPLALQSCRVELYAPWLALMLGSMLAARRGAPVAGLLWGLAATLHHALAVAAAPGLLLLWHGDRRRAWAAAALALSSQALWLYLPLRSLAAPALWWDDCSTLSGFWRHFSAAAYRRSFGAPPGQLLRNIRLHLGLGWRQLGPAAGLAVFGFGAMMRGRLRSWSGLALIVLGTTAVTVVQGVFDENNPDAWGYLSLAAAGLWLGFGGLLSLADRPTGAARPVSAQRRAGPAESLPSAPGARWASPLLGILALLWPAQTSWQLGWLPGWAAWSHGRQLLAELPAGAVALSSGDLSALPPLYVQDVEGMRQDVRVLNRDRIDEHDRVWLEARGVRTAELGVTAEARQLGLVRALSGRPLLLAPGLHPPPLERRMWPEGAWDRILSGVELPAEAAPSRWLAVAVDQGWTGAEARAFRRREMLAAGLLWRQGAAELARARWEGARGLDPQGVFYGTLQLALAREDQLGGYAALRPPLPPDDPELGAARRALLSGRVPADLPARLAERARQGDSHACLLLGELALDSGRPENARAAFGCASAGFESRERSARAALMMGALPEAADLWRSVLAESPAHPGALEGMERLRAAGVSP